MFKFFVVAAHLFLVFCVCPNFDHLAKQRHWMHFMLHFACMIKYHNIWTFMKANILLPGSRCPIYRGTLHVVVYWLLRLSGCNHI